MDECQISELARSHEPKVHQVQMKSKAQVEKRMIVVFPVEEENILSLSHLSFV
jgi:hypothetical protein